MPPEPFFSGPGIDRADQVRVDEARLAEIASGEEVRQLVWRDGLPAVGEDGRLEWQAATSPELFLGIQDGQPRFSATEQPHANARAAFDTIGTLSNERSSAVRVGAQPCLVALAPSFLRQLRREGTDRARRLVAALP